MTSQCSMRLRQVFVPFLAALGLSGQAAAAQIELPAGDACAGFAVGIDVYPPEHRVDRTFYDRDGNPVRFLSAGKGNLLTFTNLDSGFTLTLKTGGSVQRVTPNPDGTQTWVNTGHNVIVLFPTDTPPGPATNLYVGRLVYTVDPSSFTFLGIRSFAGRSTDICAALGG